MLVSFMVPWPAGQWGQPGRRRVAGAVGQGGDHQDGVGEHGQGGPAVPAAPAADLVLVQANQTPCRPGSAPRWSTVVRRPRPGWPVRPGGCPAAVEGLLAGLGVAAQQQPALAGLAATSRAVVIKADERPAVQAVARGAAPSGHPLPGPRRDPPAQGRRRARRRRRPPPGSRRPPPTQTDTAGLKLGPQRGVGSVETWSPVTQAAGTPASSARLSILVARAGLVQPRPGRGCLPPGSGRDHRSSPGAHTAPVDHGVPGIPGIHQTERTAWPLRSEKAVTGTSRDPGPEGAAGRG
jgi:hypothetical protein